MLIEIGRAGRALKSASTGALALLLVCGIAGAAEAVETAEKAPESETTSWQTWTAGTSVANTASVQRGARNFVSYCLGCHSLRFVRWSRIGADLHIPPAELQQSLMPPGEKPANYISTSMPASDAEVWFGKGPPDLSLMARERGADYLYQFLKTFYVDPTKPTGANNLRLPNTAMPAVLSALEGLKQAVYKNATPAGGKGPAEQEFDHFAPIAPGSMSAAEYDAFVRDTVNFLDYVGEPTQIQRHSLGIWVVLFLLVFTWIAWLMKQEYWKDVH
jgi:ubiquinol-cytochrome c reductase cytochrome c1 subunit